MRYRLRWRIDPDGRRQYYPEFIDGQEDERQGSGCGCVTLLVVLMLLVGAGAILLHRYAPDLLDKTRHAVRQLTGSSASASPASSESGSTQSSPRQTPPPSPPPPRVTDDGETLVIPK